MSKITAEMWWRAHSKLTKRQSKHERKEEYRQAYYCEQLLDRYDDGERSIELYNAIMELC